MPIMQDFHGFDKTYIAKDVLACRKAVDVLWTAAEFERATADSRALRGHKGWALRVTFYAELKSLKMGRKIF
jgi:hypothetical protein